MFNITKIYKINFFHIHLYSSGVGWTHMFIFLRKMFKQKKKRKKQFDNVYFSFAKDKRSSKWETIQEEYTDYSIYWMQIKRPKFECNWSFFYTHKNINKSMIVHTFDVRYHFVKPVGNRFLIRFFFLLYFIKCIFVKCYRSWCFKTHYQLQIGRELFGCTMQN